MFKRLIANIIKMYFENLSPNLSYSEATRSHYAKINGLENHPSLDQLKVMKHLAVNLFQVIRDFYDSKIYVSSFYRSPIVNTGVGGSKNSDHMVLTNIAAIDLDNDVYELETGVGNDILFWFIYDNLDYYKLIWEFGDDNKPGWVHISYSLDPELNKEKHTWRIYRDKNGKTKITLFEDMKANRP